MEYKDIQKAVKTMTPDSLMHGIKKAVQHCNTLKEIMDMCSNGAIMAMAKIEELEDAKPGTLTT